MSQFMLELPDSVLERAKAAAEQEGLSLREYVMLALVEKAAADEAAEYFRVRAARSSKEAFDAVMAKIPDIEPAEDDRLP